RRPGVPASRAVPGRRRVGGGIRCAAGADAARPAGGGADGTARGRVRQPARADGRRPRGGALRAARPAGRLPRGRRRVPRGARGLTVRTRLVRGAGTPRTSRVRGPQPTVTASGEGSVAASA